MNLSWLEDFLTLAATGNFSRAAAERHMTQPAFSRRVRALEQWLGVDLFDRSTHPVTLTDAGEWFGREASEILARVERVPDEARAIAQAGSSTIRIASTHALSLTFLPGWLRGLESRTTVGPIQLVSDVLQQCEALMQQRRVQLLLCHAHGEVLGRLDPELYPSKSVGIDQLMPVCAPDRSGRARFLLDSAGPSRVPILDYSAESGVGRLVRAVRGEALARLRTQTVFTAHLATVLKSIALDGRGVAWLPRTLIAEELASGRLVGAGEPHWTIEVEIRLFRQQTTLPLAAEGVWQAIGSGGAPAPGRPAAATALGHARRGRLRKALIADD